MLKDITLGQFIRGDSFLHRADPRTKILAMLFFMIGIFVNRGYWGFGAFFIIVFFTYKTTRLPMKRVAKGLKPFASILLLIFVMNCIKVKGTLLVEVNGFGITWEALDVSAKTCFRLVLLVAIASLLTLTTTPISLADAIEKLLKPLAKIKVPVHDIAMMMSIAIRFIPITLEETTKIINAQESRGLNLSEGKLVDRAKNFIPILVPVFVRMVKRAEELALAMEARCYQGEGGRTRMQELQFGKIDGILGIVSCLVVGVCLCSSLL